jgi:carboxymethylenebutenolidase
MTQAATSIKTIDTTLPSEGASPKIPIYARLPQGARRGVVVIHEIFGRQPEIDGVVDAFAQRGYAAVAPDLLSHGPHIICLVRAFAAIARGEGAQIEQIRATRRWLIANAGLDERHIGLIGFCLGGGFALAAGQGWGAVSTNYGDIPPDDVMRGLGPVIGCYGGRDRMFAKHGAQLQARLQKLNIECETHTFPEAGHAFLTSGHHPIAAFISRPFLRVEYNPEIARAAWERIFAFFDRHLD